MTYRVFKTTNRWNVGGSSIDHQVHFVTAKETMVEAFKVFAGHKNPVEPVSIKFHVENEHGEIVWLEDAYRQVVGEEVFQAQLADEGFSINLDHWLREQCA